MGKPLVSIIIVNWNGGQVFKNCLLSLSKISYPNWELIVIDNGSTDGSAGFINKYIERTRVIRNRVNVGFAPANNQGYKISKGKYILLLNNDTVVEPIFLDILIEKMTRKKDLGVVQPKIKVMDNPKYLDNAGSFMTRIGFLHHWGFQKKDGKKFGSEKEVFATKGACMLVRRKVVEKIGLFDPDFVSYFEESDFCWRAWIAGWKVLYYPEVFIYHKVGFTIKRQNVLNLNYHYYKNRICSLIKNLSFQYLLVILPLHILISNGIALIFLLRGSLKNSLIIYRAFWWNFTNLQSTLTKRRKIQESRKMSDKEIFSRVGKKIDLKKFYDDFKRVEKDIKSNE